MKKFLVAILVVFMTLQSTSPTFASEVKFVLDESQIIKIQLDENIEYDNIEDVLVDPKFNEVYGFLDEKDVYKYKENAKEKFSLDIEGYVINYYKGDDYVVVDEGVGISLITFENGEAYINGVHYEIQEENDHMITPYGLVNNHTHTFNIVGLTVGVIAALVVGVCTTELLLSAVSGSVSAGIISFAIPDEMQPVVQYKHKDYMEIVDPFIGIYDWTYYSYLYYGTAANPTKHFLDSWVKTVTRVQ